MAAWFGYLIRTTDGNNDAGVLDANAGLYLTFPFTPTEFISTLGKLEFKLALLFDVGQRVRKFSYHGVDGVEVPLHPDAAVGRDAAKVFPPSRGQEWRGFVPDRFVVPYFPEKNVARWDLRIRLLGARPARHLVAALIRYNNRVSFSESFLSGSWALPGPVRASRRRTR